MPAAALPDGRTPLALSSHAEDLLAADARAIEDYLQRHPCDPGDVAAEVAATRGTRRHRVIVCARDGAELVDALRALGGGADHPLVRRSSTPSSCRTAFVFPGQGSQWPGMGADAYDRIPAYRDEADRLDAALLAAGMPSPLPFLTRPDDLTGTAAHVADTQVVLQAAQFVHSVALAAVWRAHGIVCDLTIGHSLGEVAAAYVADRMALTDAVRVLDARARAIERIPGDHGVAVLGLDVATATEMIARTTGWLELSAVNAGASVAVSGERSAVRRLVAAVRDRGRFARELAMNFPAHTTALDALRDDVMRALPAARFTDSAVPFIGAATGSVVGPDTDFAPYWFANVRNMIRFDRAVETALDLRADAFIEMSAHPSLLFAVEDAVERTGAAEPAALVGSGRRDTPITDSLAANIVTAAAADATFRWPDPAATVRTPLRDFPGIAMRSEHLWASAEPLPPVERPTVTYERWRPVTVADTCCAAVQIAVVDLAGTTPWSHPIRDAVERHHTATLTDADATAEADIVVVVAPVGPPPAHAGGPVADEVALLAERIDTGLLDYPEVIGPRCHTLWLVTAGAEIPAADPDADPGAPDLTQAALAAMHRSIGFEYPDVAFSHVDLADADVAAPCDPHRDADVALSVILGRSGEYAVRGGTAFERTLDEDPARLSPAPWPFDSGVLDNVVITGGTGTIGRSYARHLAAAGAKRIVLLSRRGGADTGAESDRRPAGPLGGPQVVDVACDLTDPAQVAAAAACHGDTPVTLVIHAAGTATFAGRVGTTGTDLAGMAAAKIVGLESMLGHWTLRDDARILLCSSVTGVWGGKGVAAYAAVNRMLDVLAMRLRAQELACTSVRWGLWAGGGIVDAAEIARVQRAGLKPMEPRRAVEAGLCDFPADPLVFRADTDRMQTFFGQRSTPPAAAPQIDLGSGTQIDVPGAVRTQLAAVLEVDAAEVDLDTSLFDLGMDSLLALDLRKRLTRMTGSTVALATLLGGANGTDVIAELFEKVGHSGD